MNKDLKERAEAWRKYTNSIILKTDKGGMFGNYILRTAALIEDFEKALEVKEDEADIEEIFTS
jgi:hypothetical protein